MIPASTPTAPDAVYRVVMPGYFDVMHLQLKRGRTITYRDDANAAGSVVINEKLACRFWQDEDAIGKRISLTGSNNPLPHWLSVIGVVANASLDDMVSPDYPEMYLSGLQVPEFMGKAGDGSGPHMAYLTLVVRTDGNPSQITPELQQVIRSFDRNFTTSQVLTMDKAVAHSTAQPRFEMLLLGLFGLLALVLAAVGIYVPRELRIHFSNIPP